MKKQIILFSICFILFIANQILEKLGIFIPILNSYLDDLLCFPIVLSIILFIHRRWRVKNNKYTLPFQHVLIAVILFILIFEIALPIVSDKYIADIKDVLVYLIGVTFFLIYMNVPLKD